MCRFLSYLGAPIVMDQLLYQPQNSLIHQSYKAQEREEPLNGDGFGVGWYNHCINPEPAVFTSVRPAWNNGNLKSIAPKIESECIFAHVRAASRGNVTRNNCHPFAYEELLFMHNGDIGGFPQIKRKLRDRLSDRVYNWLQGETDSEHFFSLLLDNLDRKSKTPQTIMAAVEQSIADILELAGENGGQGPVLLNVAITNGRFMVATKYVSDPGETPNTLYHSEGSRYECQEGVCHMVQKGDPAQHAVLVVSEKLTDIEQDWHEVPLNHFVAVGEELDVTLVPIQT